MKKIFYFFLILFISILVLLICFYPQICLLISDLFWFDSVGYSSILYRIFLLKMAVFIIPFLGSFIFLIFWFMLIRRVRGSFILILFFFILSCLSGVWGLINWQVFLNWFGGTPFNIKEMVFFQDTLFYVKTIPVIKIILTGFHA